MNHWLQAMPQFLVNWMARVKSMFRKAALNSIGDRLFTIFEGKLFHRGMTGGQMYIV